MGFCYFNIITIDNIIVGYDTGYENSTSKNKENILFKLIEKGDDNYEIISLIIKKRNKHKTSIKPKCNKRYYLGTWIFNSSFSNK